MNDGEVEGGAKVSEKDKVNRAEEKMVRREDADLWIALVACHAGVLRRHILPSIASAGKISVSLLRCVDVHVHAGQSVIYDHRRALKASRLSLLNASCVTLLLGTSLFYPFFVPSLFTSYVPLLVHVVRCTHTDISSRVRVQKWDVLIHTRETLEERSRSTRSNYFKLSYNRIKLPIIGDCIA